MDSRISQINAFFDRYAERFNESLIGVAPDISGTADSFTQCFIAANPHMISCGTNDEQFRSALIGGYEFYKNIGISSMNILSAETTLLDDFHAMSKIRWKAVLTGKNSSTGSIEFDNIYLLRTKEGNCKIFGYITGDEQKVLKEHGLIR